MCIASWRSGPVVVTGASGQVGRALQRRLEILPNVVRTAGRGDDLVAALDGAEVLVHLAGTLAPRRPNTIEEANLATVEASAAALEQNPVDRLVFLSFPRALPAAANRYLAAKGRAEAVWAETGLPVTTFRCAHIVGPPDEPGPTAAPMLARGRRKVPVLGSGRQRLTPLSRADAVEAIVHAALDPDTPTGTFDLGGPDEVTMDGLVDLLNGGSVAKRHLVGLPLRLATRFSPQLSPTLVDIMTGDVVVDGAPAAARFDITRRSLRDGWPGVSAADRPTR
jgi:uncharacterized protein YbjT (DUF2867 family)